MDNTQDAKTIPPDVFDFSQYEDVESAAVRIKNPQTGLQTPMVVTVAGPEHPARKRFVQAALRKMRQHINRTNKMPVVDPEEDEAQKVELLVTCTLGWTGAPVAYSAAAARDLYSDPKRRWLRDQIQAAIEERELFTQTSAQH